MERHRGELTGKGLRKNRPRTGLWANSPVPTYRSVSIVSMYNIFSGMMAASDPGFCCLPCDTEETDGLDG